MADLFVTLFAATPVFGDSVAGDGIPGKSPDMKEGFTGGRGKAPTGYNPRGHALTGNSRFLWRLDEANGGDPVADATLTYPLATGSGVNVVEAGQINNGRRFNSAGNSSFSGASDAATVAKLARLAFNWTMGFWIKIPSVDLGATVRGVMTLCDNGNLDSAVFYLKTALGNLYMGSTTGGDADTNISFSGLSGQWVHCVFAWEGSTIKAWRNGVALGDPSIPAPSPTTLPTPTWVLGRGVGAAFAGQDCVLDDIWFENVLWTTPQVLADYQRGKGIG